MFTESITKYTNVVEAIKALEPSHLLGECLERDGVLVNYQRFDALTMPDGRTAFLCNTGKPFYYRGESRVYPSCKPTLYRIKQREDQICALAKTYEFMCFLETLLEVQYYLHNNLWYEPWAIAQHYEFATPMIDLANELAVAVFFATHFYDPVTRGYRIANEGVGQIRAYYDIWLGLEETPLRPIGVQPFSRPSNQLGYGLWLDEEDDFADHSKVVQFEQDYEVNLKVDRSVAGGESKYFPNERITQMATLISKENVVTNKAIDRFVEDIAKGASFIHPEPDRDEIVKVLDDAGVYITDAPVVCEQSAPMYPRIFRIERPLVRKPCYTGEM